MLPYLKRSQEASAMGDEDQATIRKSNHEEYEMLDAIVDDFAEAMERKDKGLLKEALRALCLYIQDQDEEQDEEMI